MTNAQELLTLFFAAPDDRQAERILERLIHEHADPIIKAVLRRKMEVRLDSVRAVDGRRVATGGNGRSTLSGLPQTLRELDAQDVHASSRLTLLEHLWALKERAQPATIQDFRGYVARVSLHAFASHMRHSCGERHRLYRRLWYLTQAQGRNARFALWPGRKPGQQLCGLKAWEGQPLRFSRNYLAWQEDPRTFERTVAAGRDPRQVLLSDLLAHILGWVGAPMEMNHLLNGLWLLLGLHALAATND
jgi:hypothetical protein